MRPHGVEQRHRRGERGGHGDGTARPTRDRGQVVHDVGLTHTEQRPCLRRGGVEMVDLQRPAHRTGIGEIGEASTRQVVDDVDRVTVGEQTVDEVRPDETRTSDDERLHGHPLEALMR